MKKRCIFIPRFLTMFIVDHSIFRTSEDFVEATVLLNTMLS